MAPMQQPTRGRNAWQDPSSAQPGFDAFKFTAPSSQPSWQSPATAQPGWDVYKGASPQQPASQPNMSAYGQPSFRRDETVYSPFGNFQNLGQYQQHQDAFVQQFLQSQNQYNQGLNQGQNMAPVQLGDAWRQAGENIANGTYQGNPFATGNVQALMGMFDQYGIQAPAGFQDQLIGMIGQQSPPAMYSPPPAPPQPPMTSYPIGPNGEYYPSFRVGEQLISIGQQQPNQMAPGYGQRILNPGAEVGWTMEFRDRDGDGVDDRDQTGPGIPPVRRPQSGLTGPQGEYYPGGPMTPFVRQPSPARSPISERRIDPTPSSPDLVRRVEEDAARDRRLRQEAEMQSRYPWLDPVRRSPGGKVTGWQPNQQRVAEAERAREQKLQDQGYIIGAIKPDGEKVWISPQQRQRAAELQRRAEEGVNRIRYEQPPSRVRPVGAASEAPERSRGTPYTPPSESSTGPASNSREDIVQRAREFMATLERQKQEARAAREEENRRGAEAFRIERERREQQSRETQERLRQALAGTLEEQPTVRPVGSAYPTPSQSYGTPYSPPAVAEQPKPLPAALGSSGPGWRESGGVRRYDPYTDPTGTGAVGVMGPNHVAPGWKVSPITGQLLYDPYTDPVATGGGPAYSPSVPDGRTWGPGTPRTPLISREPGRTQGRARSRIVGF